MIPKNDILKSLLQKDYDAILISSHANILYLTKFAGFSETEREAYVLITQKNSYLITDGRYISQVTKQTQGFLILEASHSTPTATLFANLVKQEHIATIGFEADDLTVAQYSHFKKVFPKLKSVDLKPLRLIKTKNEIAQIQTACQIGDQAFADVQKHIRIGISEKELANILETFMRQKGTKPSFSTIAAFGENAANIHHVNGERKLGQNECVLLDFGVKFENYCSDMTRTIFFGKPNQRFQNAYTAVHNAQQIAAEAIKSQLKENNKTILASHIDNVAREHIVSLGYPSFSHSLGHGIGIAVHEAPSFSPNSDDILTEGMVFSIEPGIYLQDKFGIRIEDLYLIEKKRLTKLTHTPSTLLVVQ